MDKMDVPRTRMRTLYRVSIIGDASVGKTSILTRFLFNSFDSCYQATIGIDFFTKVVLIEHSAIRLQLWDTAGIEKFAPLLPSYIRQADAVIICYDITNLDSFKHVEKYMELIKMHCIREPYLALVGNKVDLSREQLVSTDDGEAKAMEIDAKFFVETSAKSGRAVSALFTRIAHGLVAMENDQKVEMYDEAPVVCVNLRDKKMDPEVSGQMPCIC